MQIDVANEFLALIGAAKRVSQDVGETVQEILATGTKEPLSPNEIRSVLNKVVEVVRDGAAERGDEAGVAALEGDTEDFIKQVISARSELISVDNNFHAKFARLQLHGT